MPQHRHVFWEFTCFTANLPEEVCTINEAGVKMPHPPTEFIVKPPRATDVPIIYFHAQLEKAPTTGNHHLQGCLRTRDPVTFNGLTKFFIDLRWGQINLVWRSTKDWYGGIMGPAYCSKDRTAVRNDFPSFDKSLFEITHGTDLPQFHTAGVEAANSRDELHAALLDPSQSWNSILANAQYASKLAKNINWAKEVFKSRPVPAAEFVTEDLDLFQITLTKVVFSPKWKKSWSPFFLDFAGNCGKTEIGVRLSKSFPKSIFYLDGTAKLEDIACGYNHQPIIILNLPRSCKEINSTIIERLQDGHLFSSKYESGSKLPDYADLENILGHSEFDKVPRLILLSNNLYIDGLSEGRVSYFNITPPPISPLLPGVPPAPMNPHVVLDFFNDAEVVIMDAMNSSRVFKGIHATEEINKGIKRAFPVPVLLGKRVCPAPTPAPAPEGEEFDLSWL